MTERGMVACFGVWTMGCVLGWCIVAVLTAVWWPA